MQAHLDGKEIEWFFDGEWLQCLDPTFADKLEYRIKPNMLSPADKKKIERLEKRIVELESFQTWARKQMQSGMLEILERVIKQNLEINIIEKSIDEKIKELINE